MRGKGHVIWLLDEKIPHFYQKFITGCFCGAEPELHIDGVGLALICEVDAEGDSGVFMLVEVVLQQVVLFGWYLKDGNMDETDLLVV